MEPETIMERISEELLDALKKMAKAKNVEEKLQYSEIVKNLCESLSPFLEIVASMMPYDDDDDDGPLPF